MLILYDRNGASQGRTTWAEPAADGVGTQKFGGVDYASYAENNLLSEHLNEGIIAQNRTTKFSAKKKPFTM